MGVPYVLPAALWVLAALTWVTVLQRVLARPGEAARGPGRAVSTFGGRVVDRAYGTGWAVVRRMPERAAYAMFGRIADATWARRGPQVRRLESNLRRVLGPDATDADVRRVSREGMRSYLRYWCDTFRLPGWSRERIVSGFVAHDDHLLADALAVGRGVVVALPHMGNWDHAGAWAA